MTIKDVINKLIDNWRTALTLDYVRKPLSFALIETWKWTDRNETVRQESEEISDRNLKIWKEIYAEEKRRESEGEK